MGNCRIGCGHGHIDHISVKESSMAFLSPVSEHRLLYRLEYPLDQGLIDELAVSEWQLTPQFNQLRYQTLPAEGTGLAQLRDSIISCQLPWLRTIWTDYMATHVWAGTSLEQLEAHVQPFCEILKDLPGMTTSIHVDHRACVTAGMLFFNDVDDADQSTSFYASESGDRPLRMSSQWAHGWFTANWHKSWHKGSNSSSRVRYAVKFGLYLPLGL